MQRRRRASSSRAPRSRRGPVRPGRCLLVLLAAGLALPTGARAAWDLTGEILFAGGRAENPRLLAPDQPASLRRGQMQAASRLTLGARAGWEQSNFEVSYSPYGEFYEDSDLGQVSHALGLSWDRRFTPRLSMNLEEEFSYNPKLPTDPNGGVLGGALTSDTSIVANDFKQALSFRATEKSTLAWSYRNIQRSYSSDQLLDTSANAFGMKYSRTFGPRVVVSTEYEFGVFSFRDGLPLAAPAATPNPCTGHPPGPPCIPLNAAATRPIAGDQGFDRHRAYAGYAYHLPAGFHIDIDGGYDRLVFARGDLDSVSRPFVRTSAGWNGTRLTTRLGYEQGLDEGGGILTGARLRRGQADGRFKFTDSASLELSISREVRRALDFDGASAGTGLTTWRAGSSFTYELTRGWALIALFTHDRQTATGTNAIPTDIRSSRYALGASWSFDR